MSEAEKIETIDKNPESEGLFQSRISQNTIINVETYQNSEDIDRTKDLCSVISPRTKSSKKSHMIPERIEEKPLENKNKKRHFNDFLDKVEKFQKAKNEKISTLQAIKKEQQERELNEIPKVKMSNKSKRILESRSKRPNADPFPLFKQSPFTPSPQGPKTIAEGKMYSNSNKLIVNKFLFENPPKTSPNENLPIKKESMMKSEKVLAIKFIKEFTNKFDEISYGKSSLDFDETFLFFQEFFF